MLDNLLKFTSTFFVFGGLLAGPVLGNYDEAGYITALACFGLIASNR